jgi:hypothetical protein
MLTVTVTILATSTDIPDDVLTGCFSRTSLRQSAPSLQFPNYNKQGFVTRGRGNSVSTLARPRDGRPGFESWQRWKLFSFAIASRPILEPTQPPYQWVPGALSSVVKTSGREVDHTPPSSAEFKNAWSYTRVYLKVSGLAAWTEDCKRYSLLPLGAVVSLFYELV